MNVFLFAQPLWGFSKRFLLLERTFASKRGFKPNTEAQVLTPPQIVFTVEGDAKFATEALVYKLIDCLCESFILSFIHILKIDLYLDHSRTLDVLFML